MGESNEEVVLMEEEKVEVGCEVGGVEDVKWESVLPKVVLRVLLVEADDSTRQILTALLRKCNYKVAAISDGLKAWEILKKRHHHIDLVLTELDLPSISGYALLTLIMEHDGCKDIPVVVMSSQDSISMVLKCMLKGAGDFLIKPVRKNELKNLWRHVWRRLATNAEHNSQMLATGQDKLEATHENNPASNNSGDNVSTSRKSSKLREKETVAQDVSLRKCSEETGLSDVEYKQQAKKAKLDKELAPHTSVVEDKAVRLESGGPPDKDAVRIDEDESCTGIASTEDESVGQENQEYGAADYHELPEPSREVIDLIGGMNKQNSQLGQGSPDGNLNRLNSTPELELSLRRFHDSEIKEVDKSHTLNHSSASAFSWYGSNKNYPAFFPSSAGQLTENKGVVDFSPWSNACNSNGETKPTSGPQLELAPLPGPVFDGAVWSGYAPAFQPMFSAQASPVPELGANSLKLAFKREESPFMASSSLHSDPGTQSSTQGCGSLGETANQSSVQATDELKNRESVERHGYSSSHVGDQSGSSTPCNDFSKRDKISACGSASEVTDVEATGPGMMATSALEEILRDESCNTFDHNQFRSRMGHHSAEREAALAKFRLKRKGRCFEKKVRYQSRKRLAEQRPRVKGQFVRQVPTDQVLADDDKP